MRRVGRHKVEEIDDGCVEDFLGRILADGLAEKSQESREVCSRSGIFMLFLERRLDGLQDNSGLDVKWECVS